MKTAQFDKYKDLSFEVWESNRNLMSYLIQVYKRNEISHEECQHAKSLLSQLSKAMEKLNGKIDQPQGNTNNFNLRGNSTLKQVLSNLQHIY